MYLFGCTSNYTFYTVPSPISELPSQCQADKRELDDLLSRTTLSSEDFVRREILSLKLGYTIRQKQTKNPIFKNFVVPDRYETVPNPNFNPNTVCGGIVRENWLEPGRGVP